MARWWVMGLWAGCGVSAPDRFHDGGQSGVANVPPWCMEDSRVAVEDPSVPADGFDFPASDALDAVVGRWQGEGTLAGGGPATVVVDVSQVGAIAAVLAHLEDPGAASGTQPAVGAPAGDCPPTYEIGLAIGLSADSYLSAEGEGLVSAHAQPSWVDAVLTVPVEDVGGTLPVPEFQNAAFWDREVLSVALSTEGLGTAAVQLAWQAINDDADSAAGTGASSGSAATVEPSGMTEPIADLVLTR